MITRSGIYEYDVDYKNSPCFFSFDIHNSTDYLGVQIKKGWFYYNLLLFIQINHSYKLLFVNYSEKPSQMQ